MHLGLYGTLSVLWFCIIFSNFRKFVKGLSVTILYSFSIRYFGSFKILFKRLHKHTSDAYIYYKSGRRVDHFDKDTKEMLKILFSSPVWYF